MLDLADLLALCKANADDDLAGTSGGGTAADTASERAFAVRREAGSLIVCVEGGVVVNLGTTFIGTLTACDRLRAGMSVVFELVRLDVSSAKVLMS
jgi:hypothetical protein